MTTIKTVTVVGASGKYLGPVVVRALVSAGFTVSVLSRSVTGPAVAFPDGVNVVTTDYTSSSLQSALKGQDAIVSCVGYPGLKSQVAVIEAAEAVGVHRFIPSEFGNDPRSPGLKETEHLMLAKRQVLERLQAVAEKNENFSWTALATGPFIDWVLRHEGLGMSIPDLTAKIFDSGNEPVTGTMLAEVGQCVARILQHSAETRNKFLRVRSLRTTQNAILAALEAQTNEKWAVEHVKTEDLLESGREKFAKGDMSFRRDFFAVQYFQDGCGRGVVAKSEEEGEEGMRVLRPETVSVDELAKEVVRLKT